MDGVTQRPVSIAAAFIAISELSISPSQYFPSIFFAGPPRPRLHLHCRCLVAHLARLRIEVEAAAHRVLEQCSGSGACSITSWGDVLDRPAAAAAATAASAPSALGAGAAAAAAGATRSIFTLPTATWLARSRASSASCSACSRSWRSLRSSCAASFACCCACANLARSVSSCASSAATSPRSRTISWRSGTRNSTRCCSSSRSMALASALTCVLSSARRRASSREFGVSWMPGMVQSIVAEESSRAAAA